MQEIIKAAAAEALHSGTTPPVHALRFAGGIDKDPRTYNSPTSAEVSCLVVGEGPLPKNYISVFEKATSGTGNATHTLSLHSEHVGNARYSRCGNK